MYAKGQGTSQDFVQAHMWFDIAGALGYRRYAAQQLSPAQVIEAKRQALRWLMARKPR